MMKKVYTCFCTDIIHEGHMKILEEAGKYGEVTIGVLVDSEMVRYNRFPTKSTEERVEMVRNLPGVKDVYVQKNMMYDEVFEDLHPDVIIHGDNWERPPLSLIRDNLLKLLKKNNAELIFIITDP